MKLSRILILIGLVVVVALVLWRFAPGFRQKAREAYGKYGGWTEKARRADPVGFVSYAQNKLTADLDAFTRARAALSDAGVKLARELTRNQDLLKTAERLAGQFRDAYRGAEAAGTWPATVADRTYSRDQMLEQVRLVLLQRDNYRETIAELRSAIQAASDKQQQLAAQINTTRAALASLPAKKEIARVNQLTAGTEQLMAQVDELLRNNDRLLSASPVRTVEQITGGQRAAGAGAEDVDAETKAFLEGN